MFVNRSQKPNNMSPFVQFFAEIDEPKQKQCRKHLCDIESTLHFSAVTAVWFLSMDFFAF